MAVQKTTEKGRDMKITISVPVELQGLIEDALQSGEYESAEQIALDGLWLWSDAVESDIGADDPDEAADADFAAAMQERLKDKG
jgi:Arc/MetJ-type ribon-helix-helix transcriptional regulator